MVALSDRLAISQVIHFLNTAKMKISLQIFMKTLLLFLYTNAFLCFDFLSNSIYLILKLYESFQIKILFS